MKILTNLAYIYSWTPIFWNSILHLSSFKTPKWWVEERHTGFASTIRKSVKPFSTCFILEHKYLTSIYLGATTNDTNITSEEIYNFIQRIKKYNFTKKNEINMVEL